MPRASGPRTSGLSTGDATVNRDAPVLCCTAEILANIALREGEDAWVDDVVMDEFHWYADRDRGVAWQVPLLTLPRTRFLLMSATLGDVTFFAEDLTRRNGLADRRREVRRAAGAARVRLLRDPARADAREARLGGQGARLRRPLHAEGRRRQRAGLHEPQPLHARGEERGRGRDRRFPLHEPLRPHGPQVAQAGDRRPPRGAAAEVPRAASSSSRRRACSRSSAAPTRSAWGSTSRSGPCSSRACASSTGRRRPYSPRATSTRSPGAPAGRASTTSASWWPRPRST